MLKTRLCDILGIEVPNWREIFRLALDAASALREVRLIGWDIAAVEGGALIVEPNFTPDFLMAQLADRRGMLDARFNTFLAQCKAGARQTKRKLRSGQVGQTRESLRRLRRDVAGP